MSEGLSHHVPTKLAQDSTVSVLAEREATDEEIAVHKAIVSFCKARGARYQDVREAIGLAILLIIRILSAPRVHLRQRPLSIHPSFIAILAASVGRLGFQLKWSRPKNKTGKTGKARGRDLDLLVAALRLARAQLLPIKETPAGLPANPQPETIVRTLRLLRRKDVVAEAEREFLDLSDPCSIAGRPNSLLLIVGRDRRRRRPD